MRLKILLVSLGVVSLLACGLAVWLYFSAQAEIARAAQAQSELEKKNSSLQKKVETAQKEASRWQEKSEAVKAALDRLGKEHTLLQTQFNSLLKEKESLSEENKNLDAEIKRVNELYTQARQEAQRQPLAQELPDKSDEFLSSLLREKASLQAKAEDLKKEIADLRAQTIPWEERIAELKEREQDLAKQLDGAQGTSDILSNELLQDKKKIVALEDHLVTAEAQAEDTMQERDEYAEQLTKMKQALEQRLEELEKTKKVLESAVDGAKKVVSKSGQVSIQLPPIIVKADRGQSLLAPSGLDKAQAVEDETLQLAGRVVTVNAQHKFVVIDIGSDDGVEKGMSFAVYRQDKKVGEVSVIETRQNIAACDIKELSVGRLEVNDIVRR